MTEVDRPRDEPLQTNRPAGELMNACYDAWQAASLLVGLYGIDAVDYADARKAQMHDDGDLAGAQTWELIVVQINRLLRTAPNVRLN